MMKFTNLGGNKFMRNKMIMIIGAIVLLFGALYFVVDTKNKKAIENSENPYGKTNLKQATINQLDDPLYQNQIVPEDLKKEIEDENGVTVYFYSPECVYCKQATPVLMPVAEDLNVDIKKLNLLEFNSESNTYHIDSTPTLVHFENGEEVARMLGARTEDEFRAFLTEYALDE